MCAARWQATPTFTELLLGMGLRCFSMHPARIPAVKQRILRADTRRLGERAAAILGHDEPELEMRRLTLG